MPKSQRGVPDPVLKPGSAPMGRSDQNRGLGAKFGSQSACNRKPLSRDSGRLSVETRLLRSRATCGHPRGYCGTAGSTQPPFSFTFKSANTGPGAAKQKRNGCSVAYRLLWFNCTTCYILISYADSQLKLGYCSTFFSEQSHMNTDGYGQYYDHTTLLSCCMSATGLQLHDC